MRRTAVPRCDALSPGADVGGASPVLAQMWTWRATIARQVCGLCFPAAVVGANDGGTDENATDVPRRQDDLIGLHLEDDVGGKHVRLKQCFAGRTARRSPT